jgi:hypothetical protein
MHISFGSIIVTNQECLSVSFRSMPYAIPVPWGQLGLWASEYHREVVLAGLLLLMLMYCRSVLRWVFKRLTSRAAFTFYILGAIAAAVCCHVVAVFPLLAYDAAVWARSLHWSVLSTVLLALALILSGTAPSPRTSLHPHMLGCTPRATVRGGR